MPTSLLSMSKARHPAGSRKGGQFSPSQMPDIPAVVMSQMPAASTASTVSMCEDEERSDTEIQERAVSGDDQDDLTRSEEMALIAEHMEAKRAKVTTGMRAVLDIMPAPVVLPGNSVVGGRTVQTIARMLNISAPAAFNRCNALKKMGLLDHYDIGAFRRVAVDWWPSD